MRILVINTEKSWRGGERQTHYDITGFMQAGLHVELLCLKGFPLSNKVRELGIAVHEVYGTFDTIRWLAIHAKGYDLIQVQTAKALTTAVITKPLHGRPIVYTRRVDFIPHGRLTKIKYLCTDQVVAVSNAVKNILEKFGIPNVRVIYEVVEPRILDKERAMGILAQVDIRGRKIVSTTSALEQHKDPLTMVEAIRELSQIRKDFVFLHFGDGSLKHKVQQKIDEYKLNDIYYLMGFIPDVEDFFSIMDVFCMSSEEEGLGSSVLDAFIYKVPVVSTSAGGLAEIVNGRGFLCNIRDSVQMAEHINKVLNSPEECKKITDSAYHHARSAYSLEATTNQYIELFKSIMSRKS